MYQKLKIFGKSFSMSQVYHHPKIGDIRLLPNTRCRGIKYSISSKGALISFNPLFADRVLPLPADKEEWFLRHKERIGRQANKYMYDAGSRLQTTAFEIRFVEEARLKDSLSAVLSTAGVLSIRYPSGFCFELPNRQQAIRNIIRQFLVAEAKRIFPEKLRFLASRYGFEYNSLRINTACTRWGSCSTEGNISLSAYMLFLPENLIDFVCVHELCHTREMNHGERFYGELKRIYPNYIEMNKTLKTKGKEVFRYI